MSGLTVDPNELQQLAGYQELAAAQADQGTNQTPHDFSQKLWDTHGVISGPSNRAFSDKAREREQAGLAIQEACLTLAAALGSAAASYVNTDIDAAVSLSKQLRD